LLEPRQHLRKIARDICSQHRSVRQS
jgi:hypothetical protein